MTLLLAALAALPTLWVADRFFNRGELFTLIREELNIPATRRIKAPRRPRITVARR